MSLNEEERRNIICKFYNENQNMKKSIIVKQFLPLGFKRSTVYSILRKLEKSKELQRKTGSGRKSTLNDPKARRKLKKQTAGRVAKSYRELGKKFKCDQKTIKKHLEKMDIQRKSRKNKPTVTETQSQVQKIRLNALVKNTFSAKNRVICLMDDETYFTLDGNEWQGTDYYDHPLIETPEKTKYVEHTKYPKKVMLWVTISERGISTPQFFESGLGVNGDRYRKLCLPKVAKFIENKHKNSKVVFWPDLASCHYANESLAEMSRLNIPFVPKEQNPPNVPQLRPIEDFWANLKRKVYGNNYRPKSIKNLKDKIKLELKKMPTSSYVTAMEKVPANCRRAQRKGVNFFLH